MSAARMEGYNSHTHYNYGISTMQDDRRNGYPAREADYQRNGYPAREADYQRNGYSAREADDRRNAFAASAYGGSHFQEMQLPEEKPPPPSFISYIWPLPGLYYLSSWMSRGSNIPRLEGGRSAGGSRGDNRTPWAYSEPSFRSIGNIEGRGLNGGQFGKANNTSRRIDDHQAQFSARNEAHINELEARLKEKDKAIDGLENHNKDLGFKLTEKDKAIHGLENRMKYLEIDYTAKTKSTILEKLRADDLEKEIRRCQERFRNDLSQERMRVDALEKENRRCQEKFKNDLSQEKMRADAFEKEFQEYQAKSQALLHAEKSRADNLEREIGEHLAKLQLKEREVGELHLKLQTSGAAAAALEVREAELKILQVTFQNLRLENQELKSWRVEHEKKLQNDMSTSGELNSKVFDLSTTNGQLEKQKERLTTQVQEQAKRIQELKQQGAVLEVKMGANNSEAQSLRERLREERDKSSKLSDTVQQKNRQIEELTQDLEQKIKDLMAQSTTPKNGDQEIQERALKAEAASQVLKLSESETVQNLKARLHEELENTARLSQRLQQCGHEIDDLKHQIQDLARGGDTESDDSSSSLPPPPPPPRDYIGGESFLETEATPYLLDGAVQRVHEVAGIFARLLTKAMEQGKVDGMAVARNSFVRSISLGKAAPLKYVLEAITCKLLFHSFEHECFDLQDSTSGFLDMEQQRIDNFREYKYLTTIENPEQLVLSESNLFTHFCRTKLDCLSSAIPEIESLVQEIIARTFHNSVSSSSDDGVASFLAAKLGVTFVKLAICVWQVHKLVFSFNPMARIFRVSQSERFVEKYMESVIFQESESDEDDDMVSVDISRVDFMVVPGFIINRIVIRSRVFVVTKPVSKAFWIPNGS